MRDLIRPGLAAAVSVAASISFLMGCSSAPIAPPAAAPPAAATPTPASPTPASPTPASPTPASPASTTTPTSSSSADGGARQALIVDLPGTASWRADRAAPGGLAQRRWRAPTGLAGWCVVTLAEQPADGFPVGVMAGFDDQPDGGAVTLNRRITAPAGAVDAVDQARTFTVHHPGGGDEAGVLRARHLLTRSGTVVSVVAAAPRRATDSCRPEAIVSSARLQMRTVVPETGGPAETGQPIEPGQGVLVLTGLGG